MPNLLERLTSPPIPTLYTQAPTPYNIHYTLSTRSLPSTFAGKILRYLGAVVRILIGTAAIVILVVWVRWVLDWGDGVGSWIGLELLDEGEGSWWGLVNEKAAVGGVKEWWTLPIALAVLWVVVRRGYTEESLTVLHSLGLQVSTTSSTYLQTPTRRFIPSTSIQDIVIHEAFKGFEVRFYLAIIVQGEEDVVVVFPTLLPKRKVLEEVWRGARRGLWGKE